MRRTIMTAAPKILPVDMNDGALQLYVPLWYPYDDMTGSPVYSYGRNRKSGVVTGAVWNNGSIPGRYFDGVDDKIVFTNDASIQLGSAFTFFAWVYLTTLADRASNVYVIAHKTNFPNSGWYMQVAETTGTMEFNFCDGANHAAYGPSNIAINTWTCVGAVSDGVNTTVYKDGTPGIPAASGVLTAGATDLTIGHPVDDRVIQGYIGDIVLYNRAFTISEVRDFCQSTKWRYM